MTGFVRGVLVVVLSLAVPASVSAVEPPVPALPAPEPPAAEPEAETDEREPEVDPNSPRAALRAYLELARDGQNEEAAEYLQVPEDARPRAAELAERLRFVLERHDGADPSELSPRAEGDEDDGLPPGVDRAAVVTLESGKTEDVLLKRVPSREGRRWVFARQSVRRIDDWYYDLREHRWLEAMPAPLRRTGPFNLLWWQWGAFAIVLAVGWLLGSILGEATIRGLKEIAKRTPPDWDDEIVARKRGPVTLLWGALTCWALLPLVDLYPAADSTVKAILRLTAYVALFWAFTRAADVMAANVSRRDWARRNPASRALIPLAARLLKVLVFGLAVVGLLAQLGYPVASLLAGLGIGGLAVALAAQKTVENLFGALSIAVDQPLREGDLVRVGEHVGTVEAIGLRSTRIRSEDRTLISIPNGILADTKIESFAVRDRMLLACTIRLAYDTKVDQLRRLLGELERILQAHPKIWPETIHVHFAAFGDSSLDVEVTAWFKTTALAEFLEIRQEILLAFMKAIDDAGTALALPTQTLHVSPPGSVPGT